MYKFSVLCVFFCLIIVPSVYYAQSNCQYIKSKFVNEREILSSLRKEKFEKQKFLYKNYKQNVAHSISEKYDERYGYVKELIEGNELINEGALHSYVFNILNNLSEKVGLRDSIRLFLVRSPEPNAFNTNQNIIFVNLGLFQQINSEDQLAFILAHELGHELLNHYDKSVLERAISQNEKSVKSELRRIKMSQYQRNKALNELMLPLILESKELSRKNELEADSLALNLFTKLGYCVDSIYSVFDELNENEYDLEKGEFNILDVLYQKHIDQGCGTVQKGSSLGVFQSKEQDTLIDLLRSHPHDNIRIENLFKDSITYVKKEYSSDDFLTNQRYALYELIISEYDHGNLGRSIYLAMIASQYYTNDIFINEFVSSGLASLLYYKYGVNMGGKLDSYSDVYNDKYNRLNREIECLSHTELSEIVMLWGQKCSNQSPTDFYHVMLSYDGENLDGIREYIHLHEEQECYHYLVDYLKILKSIFTWN